MMIAMMPTSASIMSSNSNTPTISVNGRRVIDSSIDDTIATAGSDHEQRSSSSSITEQPGNVNPKASVAASQSNEEPVRGKAIAPGRHSHTHQQQQQYHHSHHHHHHQQHQQQQQQQQQHSLGPNEVHIVVSHPHSHHSNSNNSSTTSSASSSPQHASLGRTTKQLKCKLIEIIMNIRLYLLLVFLALLAIALVFVRGAPYAQLCLTRDCVFESAKILSSIDQSVSPCEDFYQFSCGRWLETTFMPEHMPAQNVFSQVQERQDRRLRELLEKPIDTENDADFVVKIKDLYKNCMNLTALDDRGDEPLMMMIDRLGGWPVLQANKQPKDEEMNVTLLSMYQKLVHHGLADDMLVLITVIPHATNFSRNMLAISAPSFDLLDREFMTTNLVDDMHLQTYYSLMLNTVGLLLKGLQPNDTDRPTFSFKVEEVEKNLDPLVVSEMKLVLQFEQTLANHSIKDTDKTNISSIYNNMTVDSLQKLAPNIPWIELINVFPVEKNISVNDEILVVDIEYIRFLSEAINTLPKRVLMNYIVWRVVQTKIGILNYVWRDLIENFNLINLGQSKPTPRWMHCVSHVQSHMGTALSNIYVKNYFTAKDKDKIDRIVHKVLAEFRHTLERTEWMDVETRKKAIHKLDTMNFRIGFPNELLNDTLVSEVYNKLTISKDDYFNNLIEIKKFMNYFKFANITIPNDREDWRSFSEVVEVNAYYFQQMNTFILNAGILQDIFFNPNRPDYLNYGAIGEVIGHEITHGFDSTGKQFDVHGHLHDWWNPETGKRFDQKASCMERQYNNFTLEEISLNVNGLKTQDENIADNGGVGLAYRAYRRAYGFGLAEPILPALNYTAEQLFWISYGIGECEKMTPEVLRLRAVTDSHAPNKYRLIGVVSNSYDFAQDFNCPPDSPMNPKTKCKVW